MSPKSFADRALRVLPSSATRIEERPAASLTSSMGAVLCRSPKCNGGMKETSQIGSSPAITPTWATQSVSISSLGYTPLRTSSKWRRTQSLHLHAMAFSRSRSATTIEPRLVSMIERCLSDPRIRLM